MAEKEPTEARDQLEARVRAVISRSREIPESELSMEATFEELGFDSLDGFEIIFDLEDEFDISIPDEAAREIGDLRELVDNLEALLAGKTPAIAAKLEKVAE